MKLETEQESKAAAARQAALEAQVKTLSTSNGKAMAEASKSYKELEKRKNAIIESQSKRISDLEKDLSRTKAASKAVQASMREMQKATSELHQSLAASQARYRVCRGLLVLASERHCSMLLHHMSALKDVEEKVRASTVSCCDAKRAADVAVMSASLAEHEAKAEELDKTCREAKARVASLEEENRKLAANAAAAHQQSKQQQQPQQQPQQSPQPSTQANCKRGSRRSGASADEPHSVSGTVNVNQNTAVYMGHPPPHISAFPQNGHYQMDPSLETTISQLHTALNALTAMARASSANQKASDMAHAKLDALAQFGIGTFDHGMGVPAVPHHGHQNGYYYWCHPPPSLTTHSNCPHAYSLKGRKSAPSLPYHERTSPPTCCPDR